METNARPHPDGTVQRLYRSRTDRQLAGVAGGIARFANTDPTLIRVLFIVLAVMGPGLLLYPLLWIFVPEEPRPAPLPEQEHVQGQEQGPQASQATPTAV